MTTHGLRALILAALAAVAFSGSARAATTAPFKYLNELQTSGGVLSPGVIFAFNPQPDPPGKPILDLADPFQPVLIQGRTADTYDFVMSFVGLPGLLLPAVQKPDIDGVTTFGFEYGGHAFDVALAFSNPGNISDWVSFVPQPDPPGIWFGEAISYVGLGDPSASIVLSEDGTALKFSSIPEPASWTLLGLGFAALGLLARRRGLRSRALGSQA